MVIQNLFRIALCYSGDQDVISAVVCMVEKKHGSV